MGILAEVWYMALKFQTLKVDKTRNGAGKDVKVIVGQVQDPKLLTMEKLPRKIPDVVRLEVQRLQGPLEVEDLGGDVRQRKVGQIL